MDSHQTEAAVSLQLQLYPMHLSPLLFAPDSVWLQIVTLMTQCLPGLLKTWQKSFPVLWIACWGHNTIPWSLVPFTGTGTEGQGKEITSFKAKPSVSISQHCRIYFKRKDFARLEVLKGFVGWFSNIQGVPHGDVVVEDSLGWIKTDPIGWGEPSIPSSSSIANLCIIQKCDP